MLLRSLALAGLLAFLGTLPAAAQICPAVELPPELRLTCTDYPGTGTTLPSAAIMPASSLFSAFTGLTIRILPEEEKTEDVERWLQEQVTYDLSGLGSFFSGLANDPDLPVQDGRLARTLEDTGLALGSLGDLPLSGCETPDVRPGRGDMTCHWDLVGTGLDMQIRLVTYGNVRYGLRAWSMNERRFRQMQALVNGFDPARVR
jgi:hypothetical protein